MKVFYPQSVPFPSRREHSLTRRSLTMSFLVLIPFILILLGGLPHFGHHSYGSRPPGLAGVLDVALAVPARTTPADAWSTTKTRLALLTMEGVSRTAIKVDMWDGGTTLFGIVPLQEAKAAAEA